MSHEHQRLDSDQIRQVAAQVAMSWCLHHVLKKTAANILWSQRIIFIASTKSPNRGYCPIFYTVAANAACHAMAPRRAWRQCNEKKITPFYPQILLCSCAEVICNLVCFENWNSLKGITSKEEKKDRPWKGKKIRRETLALP
jgi:hypothetical protein